MGNLSTDFHLRLSLSEALSRAAAGPGSAVCVDCGERIPKARRMVVPGCLRCVDCQAAADGGRL